MTFFEPLPRPWAKVYQYLPPKGVSGSHIIQSLVIINGTDRQFADIGMPFGRRRS
jgi:hypothetical protein